MTIKTVDRLDALPVDTLVKDADSGLEPYVRQADAVFEWVAVGSMIEYTSAELLSAHPEGLQVVSVPVDALLSDKTVRAAANGHALGPTNSLARIVLDQAVAHVTGEAS